LSQNQHLAQLLEERQPLMQSLRVLIEGSELRTADVLPYLWAFAFLPALCEELAFRGFLLTGLRKRFRPRTAVLVCSFMFALFHLNVFQFLPTFFLGIVLGLLTLRSNSLLPAMFFHFLYNAVLLLSVPVKRYLELELDTIVAFGPYLSGVSLIVA